MASVTHGSPGRRTTVPRLSFGEQLVLWSARRFSALEYCNAGSEAEFRAHRQEVVARVGRELDVALSHPANPRAGRAAAERLEQTLSTFAFAGVRPLRLNPHCCRFVGNDERLFLSFLAGCQERDDHHVRALLSWFFPPAAIRLATCQGGALAAMLTAARLVLPQRLRLTGCEGISSLTPYPGEHVQSVH